MCQLCGCVNWGAIKYYSEGPTTEYLSQPLPKLTKPIAQSLSLTTINVYNGIDNRCNYISDKTGGKLVILPGLEKELKATLHLERQYSDKTVMAAINVVSKKIYELSASGTTKDSVAPAALNTQGKIASNENYIKGQEDMAKRAASKGDYLSANIHQGAAMNSIAINQSFERAQAGANLGASITNLLFSFDANDAKKSNENVYQGKYIWIEKQSGAIGAQASADYHLDVYLFKFVGWDGDINEYRARNAVYLALSNKSGIVKTVMEGADMLICKNNCSGQKLRSNSVLVDNKMLSNDVRNYYFPAPGWETLQNTGFLAFPGFSQFVLLHHALEKLSRK